MVLVPEMVVWSSWLWHLLNTQNVPSSILGMIIIFLQPLPWSLAIDLLQEYYLLMAVLLVSFSFLFFLHHFVVILHIRSVCNLQPP